MNRIRLLAIGTILLLALPALAQQAITSSDAHSGGMASTAQKQLTVLTEKLALTDSQQAKIKPILRKANEATQKAMQDESMSPDERRENVKACLYKADREVRTVLNEDQKKQLDQLEEDPHSGLHGD